jgi:hypothetical protein
MESRKVNSRLLDLAARLGRETLVEAVTPAAPVIGTRAIGEPFILKYDEFGKELVAKVNERFNGTKAAVISDFGTKLSSGEEITPLNDLYRFAMITAIYQDKHLRSLGKWPVTPLEAEEAIRDGKMPYEGKFHETLAFVYEPPNSRGTYLRNLREADVINTELERNFNELGLNIGDLDKPLLIVNPGLEKDEGFDYGVRPIILTGLTKVHCPEALSWNDESEHMFDFGLENGVPKIEDIGKGNRTYNVRRGKGLYVLWRCESLDLYNHNFEFSNPRQYSRIAFVQRGGEDAK